MVSLGVVAERPDIRYAISSALADSAFNVSFRSDGSRGSLDGEVDIWLLAVTEADHQPLDGIDYRGAPVVVLDEAVPTVANVEFAVWKDRLTSKLFSAMKELPRTGNGLPAKALWLLAGSTGGLDSVITFLKGVSLANAGLGFVYAQHIELYQARQLAEAIELKTAWRASIVEDGDYLAAGRVSIISPHLQTDIGRNGRVSVLDQPWRGRYKPAIDHLAADIARHYGANAGMIVFSGMGDDGAKGSRFISKSGGLVWVQSPASCVASSMPEAVLAKGQSHLSAEVAILSEKLNHYCPGRQSV